VLSIRLFGLLELIFELLYEYTEPLNDNFYLFYDFYDFYDLTIKLSWSSYWTRICYYVCVWGIILVYVCVYLYELNMGL